jgi:hypothetical protein
MISDEGNLLLICITLPPCRLYIRQDNLTNEQILEQVDWKPIGDIYKKRILTTLMHDVYYMNVPQDLQNLFTRTARVGRRKQNLNVVRCKTEKGRTSLRYRGPIAWNQLDNNTKGAFIF